MLTINVGDIATRIVRGLGVRGRVPSTLDEVTVPVAILTNLTDPLFSQNPTIVTGQIGLAFAVNPYYQQWQNQTPNTVIAIDQLLLWDSSAAATAQNIFGTVARKQAFSTLASPSNQTGVMNTQQPTGACVPPMVITTQGNPAVNPLIALPDQFFWRVPAGGTTGYLTVGAILYPGDIFQLRGPGTLAVSIVGQWHGREFRTQ